jgi:asparagine synthase (glutamine-hydrolysing)
MCGIAGYVDSQRAPADREAAVGRMCEAMRHRGPDDGGLKSHGPATLGMRRLAIFDPANGRQPMQTPDGRFLLVFNGAIYNFRDLRRELAGHWDFRTECDTEVLLAAYARWGESCLDRLRGMYAFAVWDAAEARLFLARDPFGIKPLYFRQDGDRLLFASELNGLNASGAFTPEIDPVAVVDFLGWFAVPAPRTIYRHSTALRPGECAVFRHGRLETRRFWRFRLIPADDDACTDRRDFIRQMRARLEDTIRAHLVADVPVGAFLSGGLDSAAVAGLMTRVGGSRLRTFSIGFEEAGYSEAAAAAASARHFGADHSAQVLTGADVAADIERFVAACDQPTGDGLNTYYASQAARRGGVTVALSGLGGDELFGGYPSFRDVPRLAHWLPWWRRLPRAVRRPILRRLRGGDTRRRKLADLLHYAHDVNELASLHRRVFSEPHRRAMLAPGARAIADRLAPFHPELSFLSEDLRGATNEEAVSAWELRTYMADLLLRDSDVMSMRHSLELRVPLVDRPLFDWLWRQPPRFRFTPDAPKSALAEAVADLLPPGLRERPKQGFTLPMAPWMRGPLRGFLEDTFSDGSIERSGLLMREPVQAAWRSFLAGGDDRQWSRVWSVAILLAFINRRTGSAAVPAAPLVVSPPTAAPARRRGVTGSTLLIVPELFSSTGGIQRVLRSYLRALSAQAAAENRTVKLLTLNDPTFDSADLRRVAERGLAEWSACDRNRRRFLRDALRLSEGCDRIVCGHVAQLPVAWAASRRRGRLPYYLVAHGIEVWRRLSVAERWAVRRAHRVLCVSEFTRREMARHTPLRPDQAAVVYNGLDPAFPVEAGRPLAECPPVIVSVSRLDRADRYKGIDMLIEAMPAVCAQAPAARLRVIGQGDDLPQLRRRADRLGAAVDFLGPVSDARLTEELRAARLFALPSLREGFGLVYLEAMAHGRPCLGVRAGAAPEVITADTGLLAEPGSAPSLAAALLEGLGRPWRAAAILERARAFSYERFAERLAPVLAP